MVKLLVGLIKGAVIGAAIGYGAFALAGATGFGNPWLTYGVVGTLVGLFVGRPLWALLRDKNQTNIIAILKAAFGFGIGCGLYAIVRKAWDPSPMMVAGHDLFSWSPMLGGLIGAAYGAFVEVDDSIGDDGKKRKAESGPVKQLKK